MSVERRQKTTALQAAFGESAERSAFLCALFISEKGSAICIWFRDTSDAGSAPREQKANLICSSKGC